MIPYNTMEIHDFWNKNTVEWKKLFFHPTIFLFEKLGISMVLYIFVAPPIVAAPLNLPTEICECHQVNNSYIKKQ